MFRSRIFSRWLQKWRRSPIKQIEWKEISDLLSFTSTLSLSLIATRASSALCVERTTEGSSHQSFHVRVRTSIRQRKRVWEKLYRWLRARPVIDVVAFFDSFPLEFRLGRSQKKDGSIPLSGREAQNIAPSSSSPPSALTFSRQNRHHHRLDLTQFFSSVFCVSRVSRQIRLTLPRMILMMRCCWILSLGSQMTFCVLLVSEGIEKD